MASHQAFTIPTGDLEAFDFGFEPSPDRPQLWAGDTHLSNLSPGVWQLPTMPDVVDASPSPPRTSSSSMLGANMPRSHAVPTEGRQAYGFSSTLGYNDPPLFGTQSAERSYGGMDSSDAPAAQSRGAEQVLWTTGEPAATPSYQSCDGWPAGHSSQNSFSSSGVQSITNLSPVSQPLLCPMSGSSPLSLRPRTPMGAYGRAAITPTAKTTFAPPLPSPPGSSPRHPTDQDLLPVSCQYPATAISPMISPYQPTSQSFSPLRNPAADACTMPVPHSLSPAPPLFNPKSRIRKSVSSAALPTRRISGPRPPVPVPGNNYATQHSMPRQVSGTDRHGPRLPSSTSHGNLRSARHPSSTGRSMTKAKSMSNVRKESSAAGARSASKSRHASRSHLRSTNSRPNIGTAFVNFTPEDSQKLLSGVAPSGSSKTKARREQEAREKKRRLEEAAALLAMQTASASMHGAHLPPTSANPPGQAESWPGARG